MLTLKDRAKAYGEHAGTILGGLGRYALARKPEGLVNGLRAVAALADDIAVQARGGGGAVMCPLCGWSGKRFGPAYYFDHYRENTRCYGCGTTDRARAMKLFIERELASFFASERKRVLDIGPVSFSRKLFPDSVQYISTDLSSPLAMVKADLTDTPFAGASFDFWLCAHVLDVIPDDTAAMRELFRILVPGGVGLLDNAMTWERPTEDYGGPRKGECGHLRRYGYDLPDKLRAVGFEVEVADIEAIFDEDTRARFGILPRKLVLCKRPPRR